MHFKLRYISRKNKSYGGTHFQIAERSHRWQERSQDSKSRAFGPALVAFALNYHHSAARFQSRPGPPLPSGGRAGSL